MKFAPKDLAAVLMSKSPGKSGQILKRFEYSSSLSPQLALGPAADLPAPSPDLSSVQTDQLAAAMKTGDQEKIEQAVVREIARLKSSAGSPEIAEQFTPIPKKGRCLTVTEAIQGFEPVLRRLPEHKWWHKGLQPAGSEHLPREAASFILGCLEAVKARLNGAGVALQEAKEAGNYLIWTQEQASSGVIPIPAIAGCTRDGAFLSADRFLRKATASGALESIRGNGWIIDDLDDGGLQFDTGEAGIALFNLYQITGEKKFLRSAESCASWAEQRPVVPNWNYNSFSVYLLSKAYEVTGQKHFLDSAVRKARTGVIPGQLTAGPRAGSWFDGHNARRVYHYIMMRSLAQLLAVMPADHPDRATIRSALCRGLAVSNQELIDCGAPTKNSAVTALILVVTLLKSDPELIKSSKSDQALDRLSRLVSEQYRHGRLPLSPASWGQFLNWVVTRQQVNGL